MISLKVFCASLVLLGATSTVSGGRIFGLGVNDASENGDNAVEDRQLTLRLVTVVMRHGERAPADTFPTDPYVNSLMEPFGWGQLTKKGRSNVYRTGEFLRTRYGKFLGDSYSPDRYWLQTSAIDRTKMTGMIMSAALWKPNDKQTFIEGLQWQPVSLHYWERPEDRLLIIWNACPRLTQERMRIEEAPQVKKFNEDNKNLYEELKNLTGMPITGPADVASFYSTLKAETAMDLNPPEWTKQYFPERVEPSGIFSLSMNVFNEELRKLAGGPLVKKSLDTMLDKSRGTLKPADRRMYAYVGHDSTLVNFLSAMGVWDNKDPDFGCMVMIELHEENGVYNVQIFQKDTANSVPRALTVPGCATACPLSDFARKMQSVIPQNYEEECRVDDPNYVIPESPPA